MKFIVIVIIAGVLGFAVSVTIFSYSNSESPFFEYTISGKKDKIINILNRRINILNKNCKNLNSLLNKIDNQLFELASKKDSPGYGELIANKREERKIAANKLKNTENYLYKSIRERNELIYFNSDVDSTYYTKYFSVDRSSFFEKLNLDDFTTDTTSFKKYVKFAIIDTTSISLELEADSINKGLAILEKITYDKKVSFVNKYPAFGFWLVLSIGQGCIWFIVGTIIVLLFLRKFYILPNITNLKAENNINEANLKDDQSSDKNKLKHEIETQKKIINEESWKIFGLVVFVGLVVGFFLFFTFKYLIDSHVLKDHFFIENFRLRIKLYGFIGYFVASLCFFIYLYTAYKIHQLDDENTKPNQSTETKNFIDIDFDNITSTFDYSFAFSALILSIFVIWLGTMFKAINSLDLMNYYHQISGKHYLNNDYVYLVGILHSLLLLIFYIPVQIKFNSLKIIGQQKQTNEGSIENSSTFKKVFNGLFKNLSPVLLTASPLLSSFIQNLITSFISE